MDTYGLNRRRLVKFTEDTKDALPNSDLMLSALLGTGLR